MSVPVECVISCKKYACFQHTALIILGLVKMIFVMFFRDVPWEYIFNLYAFVAPEHCEWVYVRVVVYIAQ